MRFSTIQIAWRNLGRNRKRTGLALAAIAVGQLCLLAMAGMMNGFGDEILKAITGPAVGDIQVHAHGWRKERAVDMSITGLEPTLDAIRSDAAVEGVFPRVFSPALVAPREEAHMAAVIGLDPEVESGERGLLRGLGAGLGGRRVFVGRIASQRMRTSVGDEIAVVGQAADGSLANGLYTVSSIGMTQLDMVNRQGVVMSLEDAQEFLAMDDEAHQIIVHARDREGLDALVERLRQSSALQGYEVLSWRELVPQMVDMVEMMDYATFYVLVFVFVAAVAGVANTMLMSTYERVHELGMILALGASPWRIVRMVFAEAAVLGLVGAAIGTVAGCVLVVVTSYTGLNFAAMGGETVENFAFEGTRMPLLVYPWLKVSDVLIGVVAVLVTSITAAVWPAVIAARLEPMEALRD
jgi:ABC-type lipoprotein release transport system permease subunit